MTDAFLIFEAVAGVAIAAAIIVVVVVVAVKVLQWFRKWMVER